MSGVPVTLVGSGRWVSCTHSVQRNTILYGPGAVCNEFPAADQPYVAIFEGALRSASNRSVNLASCIFDTTSRSAVTRSLTDQTCVYCSRS
jgi:hypothetical protein